MSNDETLRGAMWRAFASGHNTTGEDAMARVLDAVRAHDAALAAPVAPPVEGEPTDDDIVRERRGIHDDTALVAEFRCPMLTGERGGGHAVKCNREAVRRARASLSKGGAT